MDKEIKVHREECGGFVLYLSYLFVGQPTNDYLECIWSDEPIVIKDPFDTKYPGYALVKYNFRFKLVFADEKNGRTRNMT